MKFIFRDETPRLKAEVGKAVITSLSHAAGYIYKAARNSIKRRKSSSLPGEPPHTQTGVLKRGIAYDVDKGRQTAVIGPTQSAVGIIAHTHEFGGTEAPKRPGDRGAPKPRFRLVIGGFGPIKVIGKKLIVVSLRTDRRVARAEAIAATIPPSKGGPPSRKPRVYPARPFMGPALQRSLSRLPSFWANSIKGG